MNKILITLLTILQFSIVFSQKKLSNTTKCDTNRISSLIKLSNKYKTKDLFKAERFCLEALNLASPTGNKKQIAKIYYTLGTVHNLREDEVLTLDYFSKV